MEKSIKRAIRKGSPGVWLISSQKIFLQIMIKLQKRIDHKFIAGLNREDNSQELIDLLISLTNKRSIQKERISRRSS
jgi:hypothetical protein